MNPNFDSKQLKTTLSARWVVFLYCYNYYMDNCPICNLINNPGEKDVIILENEYWRVTLNPNQKQLGRCYVTLRRHVESLAGLNTEEWLSFNGLCKKLEEKIKSSFDPTHFNWSCLMNNAVRDSQSTHVHWHLVPRYRQRIKLLEKEFTDSDWPDKYTSSPPNVINIDILSQTRDKILQ